MFIAAAHQAREISYPLRLPGGVSGDGGRRHQLLPQHCSTVAGVGGSEPSAVALAAPVNRNGRAVGGGRRGGCPIGRSVLQLASDGGGESSARFL